MPAIDQKIPSPLTETAFADRTFFDYVNTQSADGMFTICHRPLKAIKFKDALDNVAWFYFKDEPR
jgi:hypothetical protein